MKSNNIQYKQWGTQDTEQKGHGQAMKPGEYHDHTKLGDGPKDKQLHTDSLCLAHMVCSSRKCHLLCPPYELFLVGLARQQSPRLTHTGNCQPGVCHSHLVELLCSRMRNPQPTTQALPTPEVMLPSCSGSLHQFCTTSRQGEPMGHMSRQSD